MYFASHYAGLPECSRESIFPLCLSQSQLWQWKRPWGVCSRSQEYCSGAWKVNQEANGFATTRLCVFDVSLWVFSRRNSGAFGCLEERCSLGTFGLNMFATMGLVWRLLLVPFQFLGSFLPRFGITVCLNRRVDIVKAISMGTIGNLKVFQPGHTNQ